MSHNHNIGSNLELWGGMECTIARIGDAYRDQWREMGQCESLQDLELLASLGIKRLRFPILWEAIASGIRSWEWYEERLKKLEELGIEPIVGLLHHGSGPSFTNLIDPHFPFLFAHYAREVALHFPWLRFFTPVNEPLTTARFSCLYGHWYPHKRDSKSFLLALYHQCQAIRLAMRAIRDINPKAELIQTEDMGKTFSSRRLQYQADFENERRWLSLDLLSGRINRDHPWYPRLVKSGIPVDGLEEFLQGDSIPDLIGINHYLTSERYLDHRMHRYASVFHGSNKRHSYADIEAVRMDVLPADIGPKARLREVWRRYRRPLAVTEVHHNSTREEQMRWLNEVWEGARSLRQSGTDVRAVTLWALLGATDWNSLLVRQDKYYESGAFDIRGHGRRATSIARIAKNLALNGRCDHPVLDIPGWWHRSERRYHPKRRQISRTILCPNPRRILITGASGTLGRAFARICQGRGLEYVLLNRQEMDVANPAAVDRALDHIGPWAVINTAGYVQVARAEKNIEACMRENTAGAEILARACASRALPYVTFSSDLVFDGHLGRPYTETDQANPTTVYGTSKAEAEKRVSLAHPHALIARTSAFFGPWDQYNFIYQLVDTLKSDRLFYASDTNIVSPTYVPDLVHATLDLLIDEEIGIWHLVNQGAISWYQFARYVVRALHLDQRKLIRQEGEPIVTALESERGQLLPSLNSALVRCLKESPILPSPEDEKILLAAE